MKTPIVISTCALLIGLYGITPALAESFDDRGLDWTATSPMPTATAASTPRTLPANGSFASSWNRGGKTLSQYQGPAASSARLDAGRSCDVALRVGFNQRNAFPTC
jgi:hypothetical protein